MATRNLTLGLHPEPGEIRCRLTGAWTAFPLTGRISPWMVGAPASSSGGAISEEGNH